MKLEQSVLHESRLCLAMSVFFITIFYLFEKLFEKTK